MQTDDSVLPPLRGLDDLVARWALHVDAVAQDRLDDQDSYLLALDCRNGVAKALAVADDMQRATVLPRLEKIDQRFRLLVLVTDGCAWGAAQCVPPRLDARTRVVVLDETSAHHLLAGIP